MWQAMRLSEVSFRIVPVFGWLWDSAILIGYSHRQKSDPANKRTIIQRTFLITFFQITSTVCLSNSPKWTLLIFPRPPHQRWFWTMPTLLHLQSNRLNLLLLSPKLARKHQLPVLGKESERAKHVTNVVWREASAVVKLMDARNAPNSVFVVLILAW